MGQTSLPLLNRSGTFSYWDKNWDSLHQYGYYITKFNYLDEFFYYFFQNKVFITQFKTIKKFQKIPTYFFKGFFIKKKLLNFNKMIYKFYFCSSKLWIFKYGNWVIVSIYLYDLGAKQQKKKK